MSWNNLKYHENVERIETLVKRGSLKRQANRNLDKAA
ncbi:hypothetical protein DESC_780205 [Desulfosarcina cetonica]|nr:hypothetical protein DESC_780205 [Desulfosarcina cetonica]